MTRSKSVGLLVVAVLLLAGCQSAPDGPKEPEPSWLVTRSLPDRTLFPRTVLKSPTRTYEAGIVGRNGGQMQPDDQTMWCAGIRGYVPDPSPTGLDTFAPRPRVFTPDFRDDRCFDAWTEVPLFFWDRTEDRLWILVDRAASAGNAPLVRVIERAANTWTARDIPPEADPSLPDDVRAAKPAPFWAGRR